MTVAYHSKSPLVVSLDREELVEVLEAGFRKLFPNQSIAIERVYLVSKEGQMNPIPIERLIAEAEVRFLTKIG